MTGAEFDAFKDAALARHREQHHGRRAILAQFDEALTAIHWAAKEIPRDEWPSDWYSVVSAVNIALRVRAQQ